MFDNVSSSALYAAENLVERAVRTDRKPSLDTAAVYYAAATLFDFLGDDRRKEMCEEAGKAIHEAIRELEEEECPTEPLDR